MRAGENALRAGTPAIAKTVEPISGLEEFDIPDVRKVDAACEDAGFEFTDGS